MSVDKAQLATIQVFAELSTSTLEHIAHVSLIVEHPAGKILFQQGSNPSGLFILLDGIIILFRQSKEKSQILSIVTVNETFGSESTATAGPCPYAAKSITPVKTLYIDAKDLTLLLEEHRDFLALYVSLIARRIRQLTSVVHKLAFHDVTSRVAGVLLTLAETNSEQTDAGLRIPRVLSQKDLAAMVGTAREVIYRILKHFEEENLIRKTRTDYYILDVDTLLQIASQETR
jgi:CRP-like cAMP-binding protein